MKRWRLMIGFALLAGGLTACQQTPAADPVTTSPPKLVSMLTFNACGGCERTLPGAEWRERMAKMIDLYQPEIVLLQEICRGQYNLLNAEFTERPEGDDARHAYTPAWRTTVKGHGECGQWTSGAKDIGLAILVRGRESVANVTYWPLSAPKTLLPRQMLCVDASPGGEQVRACTVQIDRDAVAGPEQMGEVSRLVNDWARTGPVLLGGDFNTRSTSALMKKLYAAPIGMGRFRELDDSSKQYFGKTCPQTEDRCRTGHGTLADYPDAKSDFLFVSEPHLVPAQVAVDTGSVEVSDHYALIGTAVFARPDATAQPSVSAAPSASAS